MTVLLAAAGCEVGPDYHTPKEHMPSSWVAPPTTQASITVQSPLQVERWWTTFNDPTLNSLVERAVASNLDVKQAEERIRQERASLGVAEAGLYPQVYTPLGYTRSFNNNIPNSTVTLPSGRTRVIRNRPTDTWEGGFDATWELDIFGGVRRGVEAAEANVQAAVEDRRDVLVTLLGEVATDYMDLRGYQQQVQIAQENLTSQIRSVEVTRKKMQGGLTTGLDVANAEAEVATTRASIAQYQSLAQQQIYAISVLLGQEPAVLLPELSPAAKIPVTPPLVPVGLPAELLRRRPDIRRAERQLAAATAEIGVATAGLYPQFTLSGDLSLGGSRYQQLTSWGTRIWSFGPSMNWPLFAGGAIVSNIRVQNSLQAQALLTYRQTILGALQDVENALTAYAQEQQRRTALADAVAADQRAVAIATHGYEQGLTDFLNVLVAQQSLLSAQNALVESNQAVATDLVALYKALGGGWEIGEPTTRPATANRSSPTGKQADAGGVS